MFGLVASQERVKQGGVMKTDKKLYEFCKGHYYADETTLWEPFEDWNAEDVEEQIKIDVISLKQFLKGE